MILKMARAVEKIKVTRIFVDAVSKVLKEWQALEIALYNTFGGPLSREKALWMKEVTFD